MKKQKRQSNGFSLIELIIVVIIISILVTLAYPLFSSVINKARISGMFPIINSLEKQLEMVVLEYGWGADAQSKLPQGMVTPDGIFVISPALFPDDRYEIIVCTPWNGDPMMCVGFCNRKIYKDGRRTWRIRSDHWWTKELKQMLSSETIE